MDHKIEYLMERYLSGNCTSEELGEFLALVRAGKNDDQVRKILSAGWDTFQTDEKLPIEKADAIFQNILQQGEGFHKRHISKIARIKIWTRIAVAASVALLVGTGIYFALFNKQQVLPATKEQVVSHDIKAPSVNRATITLGNGTKIFLDSAASGKIADQGATTITKTASGVLAYQSSGKDASIVYNTLTNPRGSKAITIALSDGSQVWLNAESSLRYPVQFIGSERKVEITGEAYFEVAHDTNKKFLVEARGTTTEVLGTHFNVNAYDDEKDIKITLLQGSVKVRTEKSEVKIKPGEQAVYNRQAILSIQKNIDIEQVMAWRNDRFIFSGDNIQTVMRQLSRWYDAEVIYEGNVPADEFVGVISRSRNENISAVLDLLQKTKTVSFKIEGKKVTVSAYKN